MSRTLHLFGTDWCAMMVPIQVIRWYRMQCYDGTDSCATVVPNRRYCQFFCVLIRTSSLPKFTICGISENVLINIFTIRQDCVQYPLVCFRYSVAISRMVCAIGMARQISRVKPYCLTLTKFTKAMELHLFPNLPVCPFFHKGKQGLWHGVAAATLGAGHRLGIGRGLPFDELLGARIIGDRFTLIHRPEKEDQGSCDSLTFVAANEGFASYREGLFPVPSVPAIGLGDMAKNRRHPTAYRAG